MISNFFLSVSSHVRNLGFIIDSDLGLVKQINSVVKNSFYQLRLISKVKSALSFKDLETVIHAFITSRLDYCNSLYDGLPQSSMPVFRWCRMLLPEFYRPLESLTTLPQSWPLSTGFLSSLEYVLKFYCLFLKLLMDRPLHISRTF